MGASVERQSRSIRLGLIVALSGVVTAAPMGVAAPASTDDPRGFDRELAERTFDAAWRIVHETHFDPTFNGVDWDAVREDLRPRLDEITSPQELRALIQDMVSRLGQSHFAILSDREAYEISEEAAEVDRDAAEVAADPDAVDEEEASRLAGEGEIGFEFRLIDEQIIVTRIHDDSAADRAGVQLGWVLEAIGSRRVADLIDRIPDTVDGPMRDLHAWQMIKARLDGRAGRAVALTFLDAGDEPVERTVVRRPVQGVRTKFGNLPTMYAHLEHERITVGEPPANIGVIRFNIWMIPIAQPFARAMDELRDADGIILDLRGNIGGIGGMVMGTSGHFLDEQVSLGTMKTRDSELKFVANPRRVSNDGRPVKPFSGPLAILVDGRSASTTEIFTGGLQAIGRARVFGERTMGAALPAMMARLPNGDVLLHAIADFLDPNGRSLEGTGAQPDHVVVPSRDDLLVGRDVVLEAAANWIAVERLSDRTGGASQPAVPVGTAP